MDRQHRSIRRVNIMLMLTAVVVGGAILFFATPQGNDADEVGAGELEVAAGTGDGGRTVDTSPFRLPSNGDGSTTLPESFIETQTTTTTSTTLPITTTTFPLPGSHPDAVCNGFIDLLLLARDARDRPDTLEPAQVAAFVADLARRLEQIGEPAYEPAVAQLDESAARLGASSSDDELREAVRGMLASEDPWAPVVSHAQGTCPEILTFG